MNPRSCSVTCSIIKPFYFAQTASKSVPNRQHVVVFSPLQANEVPILNKDFSCQNIRAKFSPHDRFPTPLKSGRPSTGGKKLFIKVLNSSTINSCDISTNINGNFVIFFLMFSEAFNIPCVCTTPF
jgi:hypothetical protein